MKLTRNIFFSQSKGKHLQHVNFIFYFFSCLPCYKYFIKGKYKLKIYIDFFFNNVTFYFNKSLQYHGAQLWNQFTVNICNSVNFKHSTFLIICKIKNFDQKKLLE